MQNIESRALDDGATLRAATPADAHRIHTLIRELAEFEREPDSVITTAETIETALSEVDGPTRCHVIERDGDVVAIALWYRSFSTWTGNGIWLEDLYVSPAQRGRGYSSILVASLARYCLDAGWSRIEWTALNWNTRAIDQYIALGARPMSEHTSFRLEGTALSGVAGRLAS